jgi:hypothetical protein
LIRPDFLQSKVQVGDFTHEVITLAITLSLRSTNQYSHPARFNAWSLKRIRHHRDQLQVHLTAGLHTRRGLGKLERVIHPLRRPTLRNNDAPARSIRSKEFFGFQQLAESHSREISHLRDIDK